MVLDNPKHEAFAQAVACGDTPTAAYRKAYGAKDATCEQRGCRLAADIKVKSRIAELKERANDIAEKKADFGKEELIRYLVETLQTPVGDVDESHRLCQEHTVDVIDTGGQRGKLKRGQADEGNEVATPEATVIRTKVKMCGKIEAARLLAQVCGYLAPQKVEGNLNLGVPQSVEDAVKKLLA